MNLGDASMTNNILLGVSIFMFWFAVALMFGGYLYI